MADRDDRARIAPAPPGAASVPDGGVTTALLVAGHPLRTGA